MLIPALICILALWALGALLAVSLCVVSGRADRNDARGRWLAPVSSAPGS